MYDKYYVQIILLRNEEKFQSAIGYIYILFRCLRVVRLSIIVILYRVEGGSESDNKTAQARVFVLVTRVQWYSSRICVPISNLVRGSL